MSVADKLLQVNQVKQDIKVAIEDMGVDMTGVSFTEYAEKVLEISGGGSTPSTGSQSIFTGATIPLTYKDNTVDHEINYEYKSATHDITIDGLSGRATITGNGTKDVRVEFDVSSATSSLKDFTITCENESQTIVYSGLHAHYGTAVSGVLVFASVVATQDGSVGSIGTNYKFIDTSSTSLPVFSSAISIWGTTYSHQVLALNIDKFSSTSIADTFLSNCYAFNQPLTIPSGVTSIGTYFLNNCNSFNQPLTIPSGVTSIGNYFLSNCYVFNQPLTIPSSLTSIGNYFLQNSRLFNQPLTIPSGVTSIGESFLSGCYAFNQPLTIPSNVTSILNNFLGSCSSFNLPLTIPSNVTSIGNNFLGSCTSFNLPLTIPSNVTSIGNSFLSGCSSFSQPLTIPSGVTSIGTYFLNNCYSVTAVLWFAAVYPTDTYSLSQFVNSKTSASGTGIIIYGDERSNLISALPNRTSSQFRKLINGGS